MTEDERQLDLEVAELRAENAALRAEVERLKGLVEDIDWADSVHSELE